MKVNTVRKEIKYDNITETNRLTKSCVNIVGKCSHKPNRRRNAVKEQLWKRKIQQSMQEL